MTELTRRQIGIGALSLLAASAFPATFAKIVASLDAGDQFERHQGEWIREIAELYAEFRRVDRDFFVDQDARDTFPLAHYELASQSQTLRIDPLGDRHTKWAIRSWIDTLYPSPAVRAFHVHQPLRNLSKAFAERQAELDAVTDELGEAEYLGALYWHRTSWDSISSQGYWTSIQTRVDKLLRRQDRVSSTFSSGLTVETHDDKTAAYRASMTYQSHYWERKLNARRTWRLRNHAGAPSHIRAAISRSSGPTA